MLNSDVCNMKWPWEKLVFYQVIQGEEVVKYLASEHNTTTWAGLKPESLDL